MVQITGIRWHYSLSFSSVCIEWGCPQVFKDKEEVGKGGYEGHYVVMMPQLYLLDLIMTNEKAKPCLHAF